MRKQAVKDKGRAFVVMGVSGSGKSTLGQSLAQQLGVAFLEGDTFHPRANIEKMSAGLALTDADRWPWLDSIGAAMRAARHEGVICSCSALRLAYRERLRMWVNDVVFLHLGGSREVLFERLKHRKDHFMPSGLLDSQLSTLELIEGEAGFYHLDIDRSPQTALDDALHICASVGLNDRDV